MKYRIWDYDLWAGDEPGSLYVNNCLDTGIDVNLTGKKDIVQFLRDEGVIRKYARISLDLNIADNCLGYTLYFIDGKGNPAFEARLLGE